MPFPRDAMSQQHLVGHLSEAIDRVRFYEGATTPVLIAKHIAAEAILNGLLDLNPHAAASRHVQHNIGARRRTWLAEYQRARAGADASSA